jgi:hypothetical protein
LTAGFLGSCFFFLLFMATIPKASAPNGMIRSRNNQLKKPKFVDPESESAVFVDVGVDVEGIIEIVVGVGLFINGVGLAVEVGVGVEVEVGVGVEVEVGVGVEVEVSVNVAEIE